jgi:hypothetical protein
MTLMLAGVALQLIGATTRRAKTCILNYSIAIPRPSNSLSHAAAISRSTVRLSAMSEDDAARFRKQADECREQASKAFSPLDKEAWLRTAEEWIKLAMSVEERTCAGLEASPLRTPLS